MTDTLKQTTHLTFDLGPVVRLNEVEIDLVALSQSKKAMEIEHGASLFVHQASAGLVVILKTGVLSSHIFFSTIRI